MGWAHLSWLVLFHVLSAIIGVGPTFFGHVLLRSNQSVGELKHSMQLSNKLDYFPKIGGVLAVLSGLTLIWLGHYGSFMQLWLLGSLILFVIIEVIVIGLVAPNSKKLTKWVLHKDNQHADSLPAEVMGYYSKSRNYLWLASVFGVVLFIFMIMKPVVGG